MEILKNHKLTYLTRRQVEIGQLKESSDNELVNLALSIGHRLRGHGETFGFPQISLLGVMLEDAAKKRDLDRLKKILQELDDTVQESIFLIDEG